ncbi:MAG TPA: hypothetical protein VGX27_12505 [Candidatus Dormibacteraeota bacterium]|nr:hypothetical protein [Candidatus Dormibacteraeota bacterium]
MSFARAYFLVAGLVLACSGLAVLINFRGLARHWENRVNELSAQVNRIAHLPWPPNPYLGPTFRPAAGVFALLLGAAMATLALTGAIR